MGFNDFGEDGLLMEAISLILTHKGEITGNTSKFPFDRLYIEQLAFSIHPTSFYNETTCQDFVDDEENLLLMVDHFKGCKDVNGVDDAKHVIDYANFIKSSRSTD